MTEIEAQTTWHGGPARPTITCVATGRLPWNRGSDWQLWVPPIGLDCYEGGTLEGAIKGPYGDTYWPTQEDACEFLEMVVNSEPMCEAAHPLIVLTKGTFHLTVGAEQVQRAVVPADAGDAGNLDPEPFWIWGCNDRDCRAKITDGAKKAAIDAANGFWPCLKYEDDRTCYVQMEG